MHKKFIQLLEQERLAIVTADFDKIDSLATSKQALFDQALNRVKNKAALSESLVSCRHRRGFRGAAAYQCNA